MPFSYWTNDEFQMPARARAEIFASSPAPGRVCTLPRTHDCTEEFIDAVFAGAFVEVA